MTYAVGHNVPGFLPDVEPSYFATFGEAQACLIGDLLFEADCADDGCNEFELALAAEDVNLWGGDDQMPWSITAAGQVWWIVEGTMTDGDEFISR